MREAVLVNPYDIPSTAQAIQQALSMSLPERRERHLALLAGIREHDVHEWRRNFLRALAEAPHDEAVQAPVESARVNQAV
jgi:trehalose 6-phosphate synthase